MGCRELPGNLARADEVHIVRGSFKNSLADRVVATVIVGTIIVLLTLYLTGHWTFPNA